MQPVGKKHLRPLCLLVDKAREPHLQAQRDRATEAGRRKSAGKDTPTDTHSASRHTSKQTQHTYQHNINKNKNTEYIKPNTAKASTWHSQSHPDPACGSQVKTLPDVSWACIRRGAGNSANGLVLKYPATPPFPMFSPFFLPISIIPKGNPLKFTPNGDVEQQIGPYPRPLSFYGKSMNWHQFFGSRCQRSLPPARKRRKPATHGSLISALWGQAMMRQRVRR